MIETSIDSIAFVVEAPVDAVALMIETPIDSIAIVIETPIDAIAIAFELVGEPVLSGVTCPIGLAVETILDAVTHVVQVSVDTIASAVETPVDPVAFVIETPVDPVAAVVEALLRHVLRLGGRRLRRRSGGQGHCGGDDTNQRGTQSLLAGLYSLKRPGPSSVDSRWRSPPVSALGGNAIPGPQRSYSRSAPAVKMNRRPATAQYFDD
jgi:hypothetical protein